MQLVFVEEASTAESSSLSGFALHAPKQTADAVWCGGEGFF